MKEQAKRNAKTRNENDLNFLLDINSPSEAAFDSKKEGIPKGIRPVYKTGIELSTIAGFSCQYKFSDLV